MKRKSSKTKKSPKVKVSVVNAATKRSVIPLKSSMVRVILKKAAAVGGIIPVNLKVGRNFGKSDKVMIATQCCGPYHQPCGGSWGGPA
jgi:hypothetical protein